MVVLMSQNIAVLGRYPDRGSYDFDTIAAVLDECLECSVGFIAAGRPMVIPTVHGRINRTLYLHGFALSRWMNGLIDSVPVCVTVSIADALVLARSAYQHSVNYRSVVAFGNAAEVRDDAEKLAALRAMMERVCPGRWSDVRPPAPNELRGTLVLRIPIEEASAKMRAGPPVDFDHDLECNVWAGCLPLQIIRTPPVPDPRLRDGIPLPDYLRTVF
jgi:nitroimidazol reductase NimA-like FMN-containing flavoprotein (pyridoxamine 5'-phosphate oxidase superfamily)